MKFQDGLSIPVLLRFTSIIVVAVVAVLYSMSLFGQTFETDLLSPKVGDDGSKIEARVEELMEMPSGSKVIVVSIPEVAAVLRVELNNLHGEEIKTKKYEFVQDYEEGRSALYLYMGKNGSVPFTLRFEATSED